MRTQYTCAQCNAPFLAWPSQKRQFCSRDCQANALRKPPLTLTCRYCGESFTRTLPPAAIARGEGIYCSGTCSVSDYHTRTHPREQRICCICGKQFSPAPAQLKRGAGIYCSAVCWYQRETLASRFWRQVDTSGDCWLWIGSRRRFGYGQFHGGNAHRYAYELASGEAIPPGKVIAHTCDIPACVRNDEPGSYEVNGVVFPRWGHLFLCETMDNIADRDAKNRQAMGDRSGSRLHRDRMARGEGHPRAVLTDSRVRDIRRRYAAGERQWAIARALGLNKHTVYGVIRGKVWRHVE